MHNDKESPFTLTLLDDNLSLQVVQFSGREALNQPYRFDIEAIGLAPGLPLERLLQQPALLVIGHGHYIHGVLHSASHEHRGHQRVGYKLILVPALQALERHRSRRIFQHLSVPMILGRLLQEHGLPDSSFRFELQDSHYPLRPFCIQYEESDLALLQRLCEEEGIHYHFEHHRAGHVLIFADDSLSFPQEPLLMPFQNDMLTIAQSPVISELFQRHDLLSLPLQVDARNRAIAAIGDSAVNHSSPRSVTSPVHPQRHREQLGRRQLERLRSQQVKVHGQSNHCRLRSGCIVQVAEHPLRGFNDQWLVIQAQHQGRQDSILEQACPSTPRHYHNQFCAIPWSTVFRPALEQDRPRITGFQPARVCGQAGKPAIEDDQGRIQVRLWPATTSDCEAPADLWLPVVLSTANTGFNPTGMPLAGSDGLVSFIDSDPDRPVFCASFRQHPSTPAVRQQKPRSDTRLLLDWLVNRTDLKP
ncbi:type VI secretion system tip protein TssI/VgrG [Pseudomonas sp. Sample_16]|uniref:type VI secretion system Vgr family protein n=1 Tax=Pseudomonas sp. Sample_16 TaxID=2448263 RepID=UPI001032BE0A|nr:type VI secretion system tip protein TssI/VgrG [Pseudomonas sp. Sample_16]